MELSFPKSAHGSAVNLIVGDCRRRGRPCAFLQGRAAVALGEAEQGVLDALAERHDLEQLAHLVRPDQPVTRADQGIAVLVRGGKNTELNGEPVASGFKYTNGQTTIQGKGDELTLNVGMMAGTKCKAKAG